MVACSNDYANASLLEGARGNGKLKYIAEWTGIGITAGVREA